MGQSRIATDARWAVGTKRLMPRRLVVTGEGEVRQPSLVGRALPVRQHTGMPKIRVPGGLEPHTAPHKTDMHLFDSKHGFPSTFGTGMTGES